MQNTRYESVVKNPFSGLEWQTWLSLVLILAGIGVSGYLSYVKFASTSAFCAGIGECDYVQNSPYAYLAGIPVAYLGFAMYLTLLGLWIWCLVDVPGAAYAPLMLFGMTLSGTLFSGYLTYIELFVIHAICPWCVVSAAIITGLFFLAAYQLWIDTA